MSRVRLLLVRHGESTWNADGRWQGQADPDLTARGRAQASEAGTAIDFELTEVLCSDLIRARDTARALAASSNHGKPVVNIGFRERDAGVFSGLTRNEIFARYPGHLPDDPVSPSPTGQIIAPAGWETDDDLGRRAWKAIEETKDRLLGAADDPTAIVVTHSGLIYRVEADLGVEHSRIHNLEGRWIYWAGESWSPGERRSLSTNVAAPGSAL